MSAGSTMAPAAQTGIVAIPVPSGTSHGRGAVGLRPSGTCSVSVHTGTATDSATITTIAMGTPKSPSARRACNHAERILPTHNIYAQ